MYAAQNKNEEADKFFYQAIAMCRDSLGENHPKLALYLEDYATFLQKGSRENSEEAQAKEPINRTKKTTTRTVK